MKKKQIAVVGILLWTCTFFSGCSYKNEKQEALSKAELPVMEEVSNIEENTIEEKKSAVELADGVYTVDFETDSSMFRVCEAYDGKGTLTVENGEMMLHVSLASKNIVNLYCGLAEDAKKDGADVLSPSIDSVTYSDGWKEEVHGFDIPVLALDEEFDLALIGTKGKWYDHRVMVSNPEPLEKSSAQEIALADGTYTVELTFEGGSGKAEILSPVLLKVEGENVLATLQWNSPNYDYMVVDGETYLPVNTDGDSAFEIPVLAFDEQIQVIGDTVAMSKPHEVEYVLTFHSDTIEAIK